MIYVWKYSDELMSKDLFQFRNRWVAGVIADFTTDGESHFYGLPCPSAESLDPMDHFCCFDVSKIIPKNMQKFPYATFKPFLVYIRGFDP